MNNNWLPDFIKPFIRFLVYKQQRAKVFRELRIKKVQDKLIFEKEFKAKKLIIFLIHGADWYTGKDNISGGIISIVSLCEETFKLKNIHNAEVVLCTMPNQNLLQKHTKFNNSSNVYRYEQLEKYFKCVDEVMIHIPEYLTGFYLDYLRSNKNTWVGKITKVHFNILNQNIEMMPEPIKLKELKEFAGLVTITTAHQQYCTKNFRNYFGFPLHKFSVWISPEKYIYKKFEDKENLVIVSPDEHPMRDAVLKKLNNVEGLQVQVIQNLTYENYKEVISRAKWAITFGEGLDGYLVEPIFSGSIGFAVYNEDFFTQDFKPLPTIYTSYELMLISIQTDISRFNEPVKFKAYQKEQYEICSNHYSEKEYLENLKKFYKGNYLFN